jgi:TonB family protein
MGKKVQGCVVIEAVVEVDGKVRRYRVIDSLEESLDLTSIEALQKWEFMPGTFQGTPIPVVVFVEMTFSLRD